MIKKIQFFTIILLSAATYVHADSTMAVKKVAEIVVVDLQRVGQTSKKFKSVQEKIEARIKEKVDALKAMEAQFSQKLEKLQNGAKDMNAATQQKLQEELASLKAQLEVKQRGLQAEVEREMRSAEEQLIKEVQAICKRLGYDIVLPGALYTKDEYDRTAQVIAEMDRGVVAPSQPSTMKKIENEAKKLEDELENKINSIKAGA